MSDIHSQPQTLPQDEESQSRHAEADFGAEKEAASRQHVGIQSEISRHRAGVRPAGFHREDVEHAEEGEFKNEW